MVPVLTGLSILIIILRRGPLAFFVRSNFRLGLQVGCLLFAKAHLRKVKFSERGPICDFGDGGAFRHRGILVRQLGGLLLVRALDVLLSLVSYEKAHQVLIQSRRVQIVNDIAGHADVVRLALRKV
jgi:hypothetical protein